MCVNVNTKFKTEQLLEIATLYPEFVPICFCNLLLHAMYFIN